MRKAAGYTILEVLVAMIILAIALPGLTVLVVGSRKAQVSSLRFENAAAFGQKVYDELSLLPPSKVAVGTETVATTIIDGQTYTAKWTKTALMSSGASPVAVGGNKVQIKVGWTVGGKSHESVLNGVLP